MTILNIDSLNPSQLFQQFDTLYKVNQPALILGSPGIGKSQIVKEWAHSRGFNLVTRMLSQTQPGDLSIPFMDHDKGVLHWAIADWLVELPKDKPTIFFFDELPSAPIDVRIQIYQLVLDRQLGGHKLPDDCYIIAAGNRVSDNASAFDIDTALADRFTHFYLEPDPEQWLEWAINNNIHPTVLTFIKTRPDMLDDPDNLDDLVRVSPRSWAKISDILHVSSDPEKISYILQGRIGLNATGVFLSTLREINELPDLSILTSASDAEVARMAPTTTTGLYGLSYALNSWATDKKKLLQAMRIFMIVADASSISNREEIKTMAISLYILKAMNKEWLIDIISTDIYKKYVRQFTNSIPSLQEAASYLEA